MRLINESLTKGVYDYLVEDVDWNKLIDNDMTIKELDDTAKWLYDNDREEWDKFTDNEIIELAKLCQITEDNPWGRAYDDEVFDEMDRRGLSLNVNESEEDYKKGIVNKSKGKIGAAKLKGRMSDFEKKEELKAAMEDKTEKKSEIPIPYEEEYKAFIKKTEEELAKVKAEIDRKVAAYSRAQKEYQGDSAISDRLEGEIDSLSVTEEKLKVALDKTIKDYMEENHPDVAKDLFTEGYSLGDDKKSFDVWDKENKKLGEILDFIKGYNDERLNKVIEKVEHSQDNIFTADFMIEDLKEEDLEKESELGSSIYDRYPFIDNIQISKWGDSVVCFIGFDIDGAYGSKSDLVRVIKTVLDAIGK